MFVFLNDQPLGLAFDVPQSTLEGVYPVVKFRGKGSVKIEEGVAADAPSVLEPVRPLILEGNWTLLQLGNDRAFETKVTMKITKTTDRVYDQAYGLRIHIRNKFMGKLYEKTPSNWVGQIVDQTALPGQTAADLTLEANVSKHITGITTIVLDVDKAELRLVSADSTSVWKQIAAKPTTVNWDPFSKKNN